jgi:hypothetical protein
MGWFQLIHDWICANVFGGQLTDFLAWLHEWLGII